ncbi:MAG TPA: TraB/GumN family protein [Steroidobacteraceae bacterium]|nr:TraB/GumN family protein [Steroidobacteraceae bacterium]
MPAGPGAWSLWALLLMATAIRVVAADDLSPARAAPGPAPQDPGGDAGSAPAAGVVQEVEVVGEHAGPRLWRVSKGDHVVWVLGTLDPLPRRMTWRSREVESVLAQAQEVLPSVVSLSASLGPISAIRLYLQWRRTQKMPEAGHLRDRIAPALYARFAALKARYAPHDSRLEELRPLFAARRLYDDAMEASGLTSRNDIQQTVLGMARRRGVPIHANKVHIEDPREVLNEVGDIPAAAETACLQATVSRLETDLAPMAARARDWSVGDVAGIRALPFPHQREVCLDTIMDAPEVRTLIARALADWDMAFDDALAHNRTTLAMRPIRELLGPQGLLAQWQAKGYVVEGP